MGTAATQAKTEKSNGGQAMNQRQPLKVARANPIYRLDGDIVGGKLTVVRGRAAS
jgi:hypothetical protein